MESAPSREYVLQRKGGRIMKDYDTLDIERAEELDDLLVEADDPGPGDWLRDMELIEGEPQSASGE